jgi:hypothetical protein
MLNLKSFDDRFKQWTHESWVATMIKIGSILLVVVNAFFGLVERRAEVVTLFGLDKCYLFDPGSGKADRSKPKRDCVPGKVSYVKWTDPNHEDDVDLPQVAQITDRPNRVLQILSASGGRIVWGQQKLIRITNGKEEWQSEPKDYWLAVQGGESVPNWMLLKMPRQRGDGFVVRNISIGDQCANVAPAELPKTGVSLIEFFIENDAAKILQEKSESFIYWRTVPFYCDQDVGSAFRFGRDFSADGFKLAQAIVD